MVMGEDGLAYLKGGQVIAGSTLRMNQGLRFLVEEPLVPMEYALNACTVNPARLLGIEKKKGRIAAGCDADLVLIGDDYEVKQAWCRGRAQLG